jgi:hypothetical protein
MLRSEKGKPENQQPKPGNNGDFMRERKNTEVIGEEEGNRITEGQWTL